MRKIKKNNLIENLSIHPYSAPAIIFFASVCLMMLEIAAGRLAARYIGSSLYTWTAVIGIIIGGITIGYYLGGRLADFFSSVKIIFWLLIISSFSTIAAIILNNIVPEWTLLWRMEMAPRVLCHIAIIFFIPSLFMGGISPAAVKMALSGSQTAGRTIGKMYALGALGSILGTFLAGFLLIGTIGTVNTLWLVAAILLILAAAIQPKSVWIYIFAALFIFMAITATSNLKWAKDIGSAILLRQTQSPDMLYETESQYGYVAVHQLTKNPDERQFVQDNLKSHSQIIMDNIRDLRFFYIRVYGAVTRRASEGREKLKTLSIGGGGYVFPRYILDMWPGSSVDVAEIDPAVTEAAMQAFGLPRDTPIRTINLDGRNFADELLEKKRNGRREPDYDFIYMDAFNDLSVPFQLLTYQFNQKIEKLLAADGVYLINLIDTHESRRIIASFAKTIKKTFPHVYVITKKIDYNISSNFIVIASKRKINLEGFNLEENLSDARIIAADENDIAAFEKTPGSIVFLDDYVPIENFMIPVVRDISQVSMAEKYIKKAEELNSAGKWDLAIDKFRFAAGICPAFSVRVNYSMWQIFINNNKWKDAADSLFTMLDANDVKANNRFAAMLRYNLAAALKKTGDHKGSLKQLDEVIAILKVDLKENGESAQTYSHLAQVYLESGNQKKANEYFEKAKKLKTGDSKQ